MNNDIDVLINLFAGIPEYFIKAIKFAQPIWVAIVTFVSYIMFPNDAYVPAAIAVCIVIVLDIVSKYYSVSVCNGGIKNALKIGKLNSNTLWKGSFRKIVSYLVIMILAGLSIRVVPVAQVTTFISTVIYALNLC